MNENITFAELGLSPLVLEAVQKIGYETPCPIPSPGLPPPLVGQQLPGNGPTGGRQPLHRRHAPLKSLGELEIPRGKSAGGDHAPPPRCDTAPAHGLTLWRIEYPEFDTEDLLLRNFLL